MRGPKIRSQYSCEDCEHKTYLTMSLAHCELIEPNICIWGSETPKECPYLIKVLRKEKLNEINKN